MGQQREEVSHATSADRARKPPRRHGGHRGSDRSGHAIRRCRRRVATAADMPDPQGFDGCLVGAGVYMGSWVKEGTDFLDRYAATLARMPVWLFSSGPLPGSRRRSRCRPHRERARPGRGPGQRWPPQDRRAGPRHPAEGAPRVPGRVRSERPPEDAARAGHQDDARREGILPPGDFREWRVIEEWARRSRPAPDAGRCGLRASRAGGPAGTAISRRAGPRRPAERPGGGRVPRPRA